MVQIPDCEENTTRPLRLDLLGHANLPGEPQRTRSLACCSHLELSSQERDPQQQQLKPQRRSRTSKNSSCCNINVGHPHFNHPALSRVLALVGAITPLQARNHLVAKVGVSYVTSRRPSSSPISRPRIGNLWGPLIIFIHSLEFLRGHFKTAQTYLHMRMGRTSI